MRELAHIYEPLWSFWQVCALPMGTTRLRRTVESGRIRPSFSGMVLMFIQAHRVFEKSKYLKLAEEASEIIWEEGLLKKGSGLCHGISGNAYAFFGAFPCDF
eukprot:666060_1